MIGSSLEPGAFYRTTTPAGRENALNDDSNKKRLVEGYRMRSALDGSHELRSSDDVA
jgi:hypothetical protein